MLMRSTLLLVAVSIATAFPRGHVRLYPLQSEYHLYDQSIKHRHGGRLCNTEHGVSLELLNTISPWMDENDDRRFNYGGVDTGAISFGQFDEADFNGDRFDGLGLVGPYGQYERFT